MESLVKLDQMKKNLLIIFFALTILSAFLGGAIFGAIPVAHKKNIYTRYSKPKLSFWQLQSIDTMKYSRDISREKLQDPDFDAVINAQVRNIADAGASHIAIATPYDKEFLPMLKRWVGAARKYNLKVWFRGNWSGWEGWFDYPRITKEKHIQKTEFFILANKDLFEDGDAFSSCPECENGVLNSLLLAGDIEGYRRFIIEEYEVIKKAFNTIGKRVGANYFSMNADVARMIMDKETTAALDGIVTIDHYVGTPERLAADIEEISVMSGGKVVLGEFGAPIPGITGAMSKSQQAEWISQSFNGLIKAKALVGVNYWVNVGGSTAIWSDSGEAKPAANVIQNFYKPSAAYGVIHDESDDPIAGAKIAHPSATVFTQDDGYFELSYVRSSGSTLRISAPGFKDREVDVRQNDGQLDIVLVKESKDLIFKLREFFKKLTGV